MPFSKAVANTPEQLALCRALNLCPRCKQPKDNSSEYRICSHCMAHDCRKSSLRRNNSIDDLITKVEEAGKSLLIYADLMREKTTNNNNTI